MCQLAASEPNSMGKLLNNYRAIFLPQLNQGYRYIKFKCANYVMVQIMEYKSDELPSVTLAAICAVGLSPYSKVASWDHRMNQILLSAQFLHIEYETLFHICLLLIRSKLPWNNDNVLSIRCSVWYRKVVCPLKLIQIYPREWPRTC